MKRFVWLLNLGSEDELAGRATQSRAARARSESEEVVSTLRPLLADTGEVLDPKKRYEGWRARAFSPTPNALDALRKSGAVVPKVPAIDILRRVNSRRFWASSPRAQSLSGSAFVEHEKDAYSLLSRPSITGVWVAKRAFGFAARGLRRFFENITEADRAWIRRAMEEGGLQIEPWVPRISDHAIHGYITPTGSIVLGTPTAQVCDAAGRWQSSTPSPLSSEDDRAFRSIAEITAGELWGAGYFGPFGIDAYRFRHPSGETVWQWQSDVNARYTMGWALGMGEKRPDLDD